MLCNLKLVIEHIIYNEVFNSLPGHFWGASEELVEKSNNKN